MKTIRAKFLCTSVQDFGNDVKQISLQAVTTGSEENKSFSKYTPNATLNITITNPDASDIFKPKKEYYLDIVEATAV